MHKRHLRSSLKDGYELASVVLLVSIGDVDQPHSRDYYVCLFRTLHYKKIEVGTNWGLKIVSKHYWVNFSYRKTIYIFFKCYFMC